MREIIEQRIAELEVEYARAREKAELLRQELATTEATALRIHGAITVLREILKKDEAARATAAAATQKT